MTREPLDVIAVRIYTEADRPADVPRSLGCGRSAGLNLPSPDAAAWAAAGWLLMVWR